MTRLKRIKRFVAGLLLLAVCSLVVEQLVCLAWVPGYYWKLLASPVFWSVFSAVCFYLLWRFNRKYPENSGPCEEEACEYWKPKRRINPTTGLPMAGGT